MILSFFSDKESQFQRLKENLQQNADIIVRENQVLHEFRKELDLLVQERMSHIEELRLIHADINIVRNQLKISAVDLFLFLLNSDGNNN